jgi:hypothetical protein
VGTRAAEQCPLERLRHSVRERSDKALYRASKEGTKTLQVLGK